MNQEDSSRCFEECNATDPAEYDQSLPMLQDHPGYNTSVSPANHWAHFGPVDVPSQQAPCTLDTSAPWPLDDGGADLVQGPTGPERLSGSGSLSLFPLEHPRLSYKELSPRFPLGYNAAAFPGASAVVEQVAPHHSPVSGLAADPSRFSYMLSNNSNESPSFFAQSFSSQYESPAMVWSNRLRDSYNTAVPAPCPTSGYLQNMTVRGGVPPVPINPSSSVAKLPSNICAVQSTSDSQTFIFQCTFLRCRSRTFTRWYDFLRHYNGAHAVEKTIFWCPVSGCGRSEGGGNYGFPREDKMLNHVLNMHGQAGHSQDGR